MSIERESFTDALHQLGTLAEERLESHPEPSELVAYHQGDLGSEQERELQAHFEVCRECTALLLDLAEMVESETDIEPPVDESKFIHSIAPEATSHLELPKASVRLVSTIAAGLGLAVLGLGGWNLSLHKSLSEYRQPQVNLSIQDLQAAPSTREGVSLQVVEFSASVNPLILILNSNQHATRGTFEVEIRDTEGQQVWHHPDLRPTEYGNFTLALPTRFFKPGAYSIEIFEVESEPPTLVERYQVELR